MKKLKYISALILGAAMLVSPVTGAADMTGAVSSDTIMEKLVADGGGPAALHHKADVMQSPYYKSVDVFNMESNGSLVVIPHYKTTQQHTEYTCGPAAALTVVEHFEGKPLDSELAMAKIMETHPVGMADPGTNTRGMSRYFEQKGWTVHSSLTDGSPETYEAFVTFVNDNLKKGIPIMVENIDWGGHWRVIIGFDSMGDDMGANDVLILADPYDTTDHMQDGYNIASAQRFYYTWFDTYLFRDGEKEHQWLTAVPPEEAAR